MRQRLTVRAGDAFELDHSVLNERTGALEDLTGYNSYFAYLGYNEKVISESAPEELEISQGRTVRRYVFTDLPKGMEDQELWLQVRTYDLQGGLASTRRVRLTVQGQASDDYAVEAVDGGIRDFVMDFDGDWTVSDSPLTHTDYGDTGTVFTMPITYSFTIIGSEKIAKAYLYCNGVHIEDIDIPPYDQRISIDLTLPEGFAATLEDRNADFSIRYIAKTGESFNSNVFTVHRYFLLRSNVTFIYFGLTDDVDGFSFESLAPANHFRGYWKVISDEEIADDNDKSLVMLVPSQTDIYQIRNLTSGVIVYQSNSRRQDSRGLFERTKDFRKVGDTVYNRYVLSDFAGAGDLKFLLYERPQ